MKKPGVTKTNPLLPFGELSPAQRAKRLMLEELKSKPRRKD
jgi:hypothetical protein